MIKVPSPADGDDPLSHLIEFALSESKQTRGGERCLLMRLSEVMFVEVLRRYLRLESRPESGWLDALRHPVVGRALNLLHKDVAQPWTLQSLADAIGASRSTLAERFSEIVGKPPMQYLTHWRMQVAALLLEEKTTKLFAVANEVGYDSEAAFSRAFKRVVGVSPKSWRQRNQLRQK
jgi:AraC-like DNA-binding protein